MMHDKKCHTIQHCRLHLLAAVCSLALSSNAMAEVLHSVDQGFTIQHQFTVAASAERSFSSLVNEVGQWWHPDHTYSGDASNMRIEATAGGCFCEEWGQNSVQHLAVVLVQPSKQLRLTGGLGPLQQESVNGVMDWTVSRDEDTQQTQVRMSYKVSGYRQGGLGAWAEPVDQVLAQQMQRLKTHLTIID